MDNKEIRARFLVGRELSFPPNLGYIRDLKSIMQRDPGNSQNEREAESIIPRSLEC
jgi:hypothetical protein